jgi:hypothetical protein
MLEQVVHTELLSFRGLIKNSHETRHNMAQGILVKGSKGRSKTNLNIISGPKQNTISIINLHTRVKKVKLSL